MNTVATTNPDKRMAEIADKVERGERLTPEDGVFLYESEDLLTIGQMANKVNLRKNGRNVYFIENMKFFLLH